MKFRTKGDTAKFYKGYTITPEGVEIDNEEVATRLLNHALYEPCDGTPEPTPVEITEADLEELTEPDD